MIELNKKTSQDFLNREWVQRLLDAGVDMKDAKYYIVSTRCGSPFKTEDNIKVALKEELPWIEGMPGYLPASLYNWGCPTYTVSELLYKLHEWIYPPIMGLKNSERYYTEGLVYAGGLNFIKDAPFYIWYYKLKAKIQDENENIIDEKEDNASFYAEAEYPIESLAMLLIQCHKKDIGMKTKDTGDISGK